MRKQLRVCRAVTVSLACVAWLLPVHEIAAHGSPRVESDVDHDARRSSTGNRRCGGNLMHGQQPFSAIFTNPLFIGLVIAAAIAIPIAVHNSQSDRPPGS